jgi:hypothetical protein
LKRGSRLRRAIVYVLKNWSKHGGPKAALDPASSAPWFDGWAEKPPPSTDPPRVVAPRTWLLATGWRRRGLIRRGEAPGKLERALRA